MDHGSDAEDKGMKRASVQVVCPPIGAEAWRDLSLDRHLVEDAGDEECHPARAEGLQCHRTSPNHRDGENQVDPEHDQDEDERPSAGQHAGHGEDGERGEAPVTPGSLAEPEESAGKKKVEGIGLEVGGKGGRLVGDGQQQCTEKSDPCGEPEVPHETEDGDDPTHACQVARELGPPGRVGEQPGPEPLEEHEAGGGDRHMNRRAEGLQVRQCDPRVVLVEAA